MLWISMALAMAQPAADEALAVEDPVEAAITEWQDCTIREAEPMTRKTNETADAVATAAEIFCRAEEGRALLAIQTVLQRMSGSVYGADTVFRQRKDAWRARLIAAIIKVRSQ